MCLADIPDPLPSQGDKEIGIDLGLKSFLTISDGEKIEHPKHLLKAERRLARLQRKLSRRQKESNSREKTRKAVALQYEKVANCRKDFLHKLSSRLVRENQTIHAESLNVKEMLSNYRLAKQISDSGWAEFLRQLRYKSEWQGKLFDQIDRFFPSSKRCHCCGWINENLKLSDREWQCLNCGTAHDRDQNASINILNFSKIGRGSPKFTLVEIPNGSQKPEIDCKRSIIH
jgi:putative transposase